MPLLTEKFAFTGGRVDRSGPRPIIRGVLLCGATSANRRRYPSKAFEGDRIKRYADKPVYLNHGDGRTGRNYEHQIGWIRNPRRRADGMPVGDLEVKPKHPLAEQLLDDAEHDPRAVGMSHVAHCTTRKGSDGWEEVESIESVESVDVVLDPATTTSLFESANSRGKHVKTIRQFLTEMTRSARPKTVRAGRRVREALDVVDPDTLDAPMDDEAPPAEGDHKPAVDSAMESAGAAIWHSFVTGSLTLEKALAKLKHLGNAHGKISAAGDADTGAADSAAADEESRRRCGTGAVTEKRPLLVGWDNIGRAPTTKLKKWDDI